MEAKDLRLRARTALHGRWGVAVAVGIVAGLLTSSFSLDIDFSREEGETILVVLERLLQVGIPAMLWSLVTFLLSGVIEFGLAAFHLNLIDGREAKFSNLFSQFRQFGRGIVMVLLRGLFTFLWSLLAVLGLFVGLIFAATRLDVEAGIEEILLALVLYAIPFVLIGLIPAMIASYRYALMPYLMLEYPELSAMEALRESRYLMKGSKGRLFRLDFSFIGWMLLCVLTIGVGFLWLTPYMSTARAAFYRQLLSEWGVNPPQNEQRRIHPLQQPMEQMEYRN